MGKRAKQFIGAIALTATVGSGAALADSSVVTTSISYTSGEEVTSNSIESSSISSSNNTSVQKATAETSKVEAIPNQNASTELSSSHDKSSKSISTNRSSVSADISQSAKVDIKDNHADSAQNVVPYNQDKASQYTWTSYPDNALQAQGNYQGVPPYIQSPGEPVSNPSSPAKSDPLGGIIDELNFLSETIVPLPFVLTYGGALPVFAFATSALLFSLLVLILIGSRRHISSIYTDLLRYSGFVHAPRSDASRAHYFATPLKWVLSSAPA